MPSDEIWDNPDVKEWSRNVVENLVPMLRDSAVTVNLVPVEPDVKMAVEIGMSILMDKPIIIAVPPGRPVPEHLVRVADEIIQFDPDPAVTQERLRDAVERIAERFGLPDDEEE